MAVDYNHNGVNQYPQEIGFMLLSRVPKLPQLANVYYIHETMLIQPSTQNK